MSRRHDFVAAARRALGTPWVHQGRIPGRALDCVGLLLASAQAAGVDTSAFYIPNYGRLPTRRGLLGFFREHLLPIEPSAMQVGDCVIMSIHGHPMHCAIITDWQHHGGLGAPFGLIHTWTSAAGATRRAGFVVEHMIDEGLFKPHSYWSVPGFD